MTAHPAIATIAAIVIAGCTPNFSPESYSVGHVGQAQHFVRGKVIHAKPVTISGTQTGAGAGLGATGGAIVMSNVGGGIEGVIIGGIVGAIIGSAIEKDATRKNAMEYTVQIESGAIITVLLISDQHIVEGQSVIVIYGDRPRVVAAQG